MSSDEEKRNKDFGFWFYTGDWLKDPELGFCSIFARGLLIDLLCICFESCHRGRFCFPDGSARSDEEIVNAVRGGSLDEKLIALKELERSGALSRDENGVLFSRRMVRLNELSTKRRQAGSKGGSKTQANAKQGMEQIPSKRGGVTDSDSDSVLEIKKINTGDSSNRKHSYSLEHVPSVIPESVRNLWLNWMLVRKATHGSVMDAIQEEQHASIVYSRNGNDLARWQSDLQLSIGVGSKNVVDSSANNFAAQTKATKKQQSNSLSVTALRGQANDQ
jgi:hypothetical protein